MARRRNVRCRGRKSWGPPPELVAPRLVRARGAGGKCRWVLVGEDVHPLNVGAAPPRAIVPDVLLDQGAQCVEREVFGLRFEVSGLILRVLDAFWPRGATWSGQVISSPPGPSGGPSKTHLLPGGGVPRVHRAGSPVLPRLPRFATPRSVHQFAAVAAGAYPMRRPPNAWSPGALAPPGPCYWLVASGTPLGWRGGCLA